MKNSMKPVITLTCVLVSVTFCRADVKSDFANPPLKFRSRPLWFWNNTDVTASQVETQLQGNRDQSGYGGLAPLPFGKNFTPKYLSEAYFSLYGVAVKKARELGMFLTIYDEYGFPSGSGGANMGDGIPRFKNKYPDGTLRRLDKHEADVTGLGTYTKPIPKGTLMSLVAMNIHTKERVDLTDKVSQGTISWNVPAGSWKIMTFVCVLDGDTNVDYLEPDHVAKYIDMVYQPYYDRFSKDFGETISGAFYDEPTLYRAQGRVWTDRFNEKFEATHGFSPTPYYPALWYDIGPETQAARNYLWGFRAELYAAGYMKTIQDWCTVHGNIPLLGHQDQENIKNPVGVSGDLMKSYRYQDVPGIDKIGWDNDPEAYYKIVSSVAYNWDKAQVMTETYGAMGNLSWDRLYTIVMEQYAKGINNFIQHGVWYNLDDITYRPELSYRNPRYADGLQDYNTYIGRLNVLLQDTGRHVADIAVLYPIATLQAGYHFDGPVIPYSGGVPIPEADYIYVGELLATQVCRDFTFLHPDALDDRCSIREDQITLDNKVNHEAYRVMIVPGHKTIRWSNLKKIKAFYDNGGKVIATGQLPDKSAEFGHDADVVSTIKAMFPRVREQSLATASTEWRESGAYEAAKAIDGVKDTRWAPSDEQSKGWWLEINFGTPQTFNSTVIHEAFDRVTAYSIQTWNGSDWITCVSGSTIGANKINRFDPVTASRVRLAIDKVSEATPSICEFETRLDNGPNLNHSDAKIVHRGPNGACSVYVNSPNASNLQKALDTALNLHDVDFENNEPLRYIHRVKDNRDIYFFANVTDQAVTTSVRLRGKITPELWDPHTGQRCPIDHTNAIENGQPVTRVSLTLDPVRSVFLVGSLQISGPDKTLVTWFTPADLTQRGGSALTIQSGDQFDGIVLGELHQGKWMAGSNYYKRTEQAQDQYAAETADNRSLVQIAVVYEEDRIRIYRNGETYASYQADNIDLLSPENNIAVFGLRHVGAGSGQISGTVEDARIYSQALTVDQIKSLRPNRASQIAPYAWWDFEGDQVKDRIGRFAYSVMQRGARLSDGKLVLDKDAAMVAAMTEEDASLATRATGARAPMPPYEPETPAMPEQVPDNWLTYHLAHPGPGVGMPGDPNPAYFYKGLYHLHYIYQNKHGFAFAHVSSKDMVRWQWHPTVLVGPNTGHGMFSGTGFFTKDGQPAMIYHGQGADNNYLAFALDDTLDHWTKPVAVKPMTKSGQTADIRMWDPDCWLNGDTYYAISGGGPPHLMKSSNLKDWEYLGLLLHEDMPDLGVSPNEDVSCANMFKLGDKWMLLCISHGMGCRYYLGDFQDEKYLPEFHAMMNWKDWNFFAPESLLTPDGRRVMWAWCRLEGAQSAIQSLPRELSLPVDGILRIKPLRELETLRYDGREEGNITVRDNRNYRLKVISGDTIELCITIKPTNATEFGVRVFCDKEGKGFPITLKPDSRVLTLGDIAPPIDLRPGEDVMLRIFLDKTMVEVFVNDRQAAVTMQPHDKAHTGISLFSTGGNITADVKAWNMKSIYTNP